MLNENFIIVGALINLFGSVDYLIATIKGKIKPNRVTSFMWSIAPLVVLFAQIKEGIGIQALMTVTFAIPPLTTFIVASLNKKSKWDLTTFDLICGALSFTGFIIYVTTKDVYLAVIFSILSDALAAIPTIIRSYHHPKTEKGLPYLMASIGIVVTLLTFKEFTFINSAYNLYALFICFLIFVLIETRTRMDSKKYS